MSKDWMKFYYASPEPDRLPAELRAIANSGVPAEHTHLVVATYLGLVMKAHPERIGDWFTELSDLEGIWRTTLHLAAWSSGTPEGRACLVQAGVTPDQMPSAIDALRLPIDQPVVLDMLWAHYFATGDAAAVRRIISVLEYLGDRGAAAQSRGTKHTPEDPAGAMRHALFQAAERSLLNLMLEHAPLFALCEQIFKEADLGPNERICLAILFEKVDPAAWTVQIDPVTSKARVTRKPRNIDASVNSDLEAFRVVTTGYYRNPDAQLAAGALRHWLRLLATSDQGQDARLMVLYYVFARIGQVSKAARDAFEPILRASESPRADLVQRLLRAASDRTFETVLDALPHRRDSQLDCVSLNLLWGEFFVTGQAEPIERIFTALDWNDRVRRRLDAWLRAWPLFGAAKRRAAASALASVGLVVDLERKVIVSIGDLDCLCFSIAEQRVPIFKMLPFKLTSAEVTDLATKATALWSLRLNARDHQKVAEVCRIEAQRPGGPARLGAAEAAGDEQPPFAL
ncbi:MAG TPA: hypothetical protein VGD80_38140 [Kofleriaceae bacterium]